MTSSTESLVGADQYSDITDVTENTEDLMQALMDLPPEEKQRLEDLPLEDLLEDSQTPESPPISTFIQSLSLDCLPVPLTPEEEENRARALCRVACGVGQVKAALDLMPSKFKGEVAALEVVLDLLGDILDE